VRGGLGGGGRAAKASGRIPAAEGSTSPASYSDPILPSYTALEEITAGGDQNDAAAAAKWVARNPPDLRPFGRSIIAAFLNAGGIEFEVHSSPENPMFVAFNIWHPDERGRMGGRVSLTYCTDPVSDAVFWFRGSRKCLAAPGVALGPVARCDQPLQQPEPLSHRFHRARTRCGWPLPKTRLSLLIP
jgi:hypothetical protein